MIGAFNGEPYIQHIAQAANGTGRIHETSDSSEPGDIDGETLDRNRPPGAGLRLPPVSFGQALTMDGSSGIFFQPVANVVPTSGDSHKGSVHTPHNTALDWMP